MNKVVSPKIVIFNLHHKYLCISDSIVKSDIR